MQPSEYEPWSSKIGFQVVPEFVVFQRFPEAAATYRIDLSFGWTAMSVMRPEIIAGPMLRSASPANVSSLSFPLSSSFFFSAGSFAAASRASDKATESRRAWDGMGNLAGYLAAASKWKWTSSVGCG